MPPKHNEIFYVLMLVYAVGFIAAIVFSAPPDSNHWARTADSYNRPLSSQTMIKPASVGPACEPGKSTADEKGCAVLGNDLRHAI